MSAVRCFSSRSTILLSREALGLRHAMIPRQPLVASFLRFQSSSSESISKETPAKLYSYPEVKKLTLNPDPSKLLVDVREPDELKLYGTIPTSINIPFKSTPGALDLPEDEFEDAFGFEKPSKEKELIFFCQAGIRSAAAEELVGTFGYTHRGNYTGSFNDWYENESKNSSKAKEAAAKESV